MNAIDPEGMPQVILRAKSKDNKMGGGFIAAYKCLAIACMKIPPEVVQWGGRFFTYAGKHTKGNEDLIYVEACMFPLIDGATCEESEEDPTFEDEGGYF